MLSRIKRAFSTDRYMSSSVRQIQGMGNGAKARPFNYDRALSQFRHWAYAAAMLNANAVANVPLRLYVRNRSTSRKLFAVRPVSKSILRRLTGEYGDIPCMSSYRKAIEYGGDISEVIEPHPVTEVLRTVNAWQNGYELTLLRMFDLQITGNSYLYPINGPAGVPSEVWRMPPQWVKIIPSKTAFVDGYIYGDGTELEKRFPEIGRAHV